MQSSDKQRHIAKCLLGGALCWSAVAISVSLLLGGSFSNASPAENPAEEPLLSGVAYTAPALPLYADDGTTLLPNNSLALPEPEDAAAPSEGLTEKQMLAWLEEQKKQEQEQQTQTPETPDKPSEPERPSAPEVSDTPSDSTSDERALGSEEGFVYYRQDWSEYKNGFLRKPDPRCLRLRTDQYGDDHFVADRRAGFTNHAGTLCRAEWDVRQRVGNGLCFHYLNSRRIWFEGHHLRTERLRNTAKRTVRWQAGADGNGTRHLLARRTFSDSARHNRRRQHPHCRLDQLRKVG